MSNPTVLLVDDEQGIREGLKDVFELNDINVVTADNGRDAIRCLEKGGIDAILTDIRMPMLNGMEFADHVKSIDPTLQIVGMSGFTDYTQDDLFLAGVDHFVPKPADAEQLMSILLEYINNREAIRGLELQAA